MTSITKDALRTIDQSDNKRNVNVYELMGQTKAGNYHIIIHHFNEQPAKYCYISLNWSEKKKLFFYQFTRRFNVRFDKLSKQYLYKTQDNINYI